MKSCWQILPSWSFYQFIANLKPSGRWIPDAWSMKLTFSLIVTFYLKKTENRNADFARNADFLQKYADSSKIKGVLVLKGIISETT